MALQNREERINSIIGYGGSIKEIDEKFNSRCLKNADRSFTQTFQCQQMTSILTLLTIRNSFLIVHAPVGCTGCASLMNTTNRRGQVLRGSTNPQNAGWIATNLNENDIIQGAEGKLRDVILEIDKRHKPELIFVLTSCASAIIGDDINTVTSALDGVVNAILIPIQCEGFKTKVTATGYDACYQGIADYILLDSVEKEPDLVNILNPVSFNKKDQIELERLLGELGLRVNFAPCFSTVKDLRRITAARVNTSVCHVHGDYFFQLLENKYGIPHTREVMPLGIENTDKWLLEVASFFGKEKEAQALIKREHDKLLPLLEEILEVLKGKTVFISGGPARAVSASALADELGFELLGLHTFHYDEIIAGNVKDLIQKFGDFQFEVANMQPFEQANLVHKLKPDLYIGAGTWVAKQGIPSASVLDQNSNTLGYNGVLSIGRKMADAIQNPAFAVKLSQHRKLPYKSDWFTQSPFKYLKGQEEIITLEETVS